MFESYGRDELRRAYVQAWAKHLSGQVLTPLEASIVDVIGAHPEFHPVLVSAGAAIDTDHSGHAGENPFLHMGLHMAVREQLAIDRPPGVREVHLALKSQQGDAHRGEHALMAVLGEVLWEAQRAGATPDAAAYLDRARALLANNGTAAGGHRRKR